MSGDERHGEAPEERSGSRGPETVETPLGATKGPERLLFIGGPFNGQEISVAHGKNVIEMQVIKPGHEMVSIPDPQIEERYTYVRRQIMSDPDRAQDSWSLKNKTTYHVRHIMLLLDWDTYPVEEIMKKFYDHLRNEWVNAAPAKRVEIID